MKKIGRRVFNFVLAILLVTPMLSLGSISVHADEAEGDTDTESLVATSYKVGDIIKFGYYEQDGNLENGKEEIEWEILKVDLDRALVVSKYALDNMRFEESSMLAEWTTCSLHKWLNNDFKNMAFTIDEQAEIPAMGGKGFDKNPYYGTGCANDAQDKIFCLSVDEIEDLYGYNWKGLSGSGFGQKMIVEPTQYAINNGVATYTITEDDYNDRLKSYGYTSDVIGCSGCWWWLRTPGLNLFYACAVDCDGEAGGNHFYDINTDNIAVRPAMYIYLSALSPQPEDGTKDITYKGYSISFNPNYLEKSSFGLADTRLSKVCALLCEASYSDYGVDVPKVLRQMGINNTYKSYSDGYFNYTIGYDSVFLEGEDTTVLVFVLRGTKLDNPVEAAGDFFTTSDYYRYGIGNYPIYGIVADFMKHFEEGRVKLFNEHPELNNKPMKIIVTGHSLGGATANLIGAAITDLASDSSCYDKEDVFVYTFGAIDSINHPNAVVSEGYENIHNITNFYDSFGPNGLKFWWFGKEMPFSGYGKFGHIDVFYKDYGSVDNHDMGKAYLQAVFSDKVSYEGSQYGILGIHCPVDFEVYENNKLVGQVINGNINYDVTTIPIAIEEDEKYVLTSNDKDYRIELTATGEGTLTYDMMDAETGENTVLYEKIALNNGKKFLGYIEDSSGKSDATLFVTNESGKVVSEVLEDGKEIPATVQAIFKDVKDGAWYVPPVQYAYDNDFMTGKSGRIFAPNANLLREEFTQIIYKNEGRPALLVTDNPFADVKNAWYKDSVLWAKENGIVSGKSADRFGIGKNITREELALMLYKYAQYKNFNVSVSDDLSGFTDSDKVSSWALNAVKWAVANGIISGKGSAAAGFRIDPQKGATRAECAAMMKKFAETDFGPRQSFMEEEEEPIALPMEEIEDNPVPEEESEDIIDDEDAVPEDENVDNIDREDVIPKDGKVSIVDEEDVIWEKAENEQN